ncbi:MAG: maleylpyruvate isomerase N-terminal domain-containing protein [Acidimicrobiales bacterium]
MPERRDLTILRQERAALCQTLNEVDADAPTLCPGWTAMDVAAHLLAQERGNGPLVFASYSVGVPVMLAGLQVGSRFASANQRAARRGRRRDNAALTI